MAYYDHGAAMERQEDEKTYIELKNFIRSKNDTGDNLKWYRASRHLTRMEQEIEDQGKKIKEYQQFFGMLQKLLPRESSIYDTIG
jgi:hypothetical protein